MKKTSTPKPPRHLSKSAKLFWQQVVGEFILENHHYRILESALASWDRAESARATLAKSGLTIVDRFGVERVHPLVGVERDARGLFIRSLRELGLDAEPASGARPPRIGGAKY
jgi:P27 family predicted phage terminase small subunit